MGDQDHAAQRPPHPVRPGRAHAGPGGAAGPGARRSASQSPPLPLPHLPSSTLLSWTSSRLFTLAAVDEAQAFLTALGPERPAQSRHPAHRPRRLLPRLMACTLWPAIKGNRLGCRRWATMSWAAIVEPANRVGVTVDGRWRSS
ncbi:MAG: hypothetical protein HZY76_12160 [Anaerolineae bacterium]|nr:MAG: hypothetical protein HZY76_12160 [Anaerolineae bacterium]